MVSLAVRRVRKVACAAKNDDSGPVKTCIPFTERNKSQANPQRLLEADILNTSPNITKYLLNISSSSCWSVYAHVCRLLTSVFNVLLPLQ